MPKFTEHVALIDSNGALKSFAPGDEAPEEFKGRVGDHVLDEPFAEDNSTEEEAGEEESEDSDAAEEVKPDLRPSAAKAKPELKDTAAAKAASTPDFTKPAARTATKK